MRLAMNPNTTRTQILFNEEDVARYLALNPDIEHHWNNEHGYYDRYVKRLIDTLLALCLCFFLIPLLIIIAIAIKTTSSGPVFYRGIRGAYGGGDFRIFKFRSMVVNAEQMGGGTTALNDSRITWIGAFLRKTKLDETPQLFNVLLGDMSFIGPRPELLQYTQNYTGAEELILQVRPGITDVSSLTFIALDEIVGEANVDEVFEEFVLKRKNLLRVGYVLFQSPLLDLKIFGLTLWKVVEKFIGIVFKRSRDK